MGSHNDQWKILNSLKWHQSIPCNERQDSFGNKIISDHVIKTVSEVHAQKRDLKPLCSTPLTMWDFYTKGV